MKPAARIALAPAPFLKLILALTLTFVTLPALAADDQPPTLAPGAKAPPFKLPGVDGKTYTLADFEKSPVLVIIFTCNHCPTARAYEERIKAIVTDYKDKGVALVAISPNDPKSVRLDELGYTDLSDSFEEMKVRAKHAEFNFPYLYDGDSEEASRAYGPAATPHAFVFDKERLLRYVGRIDDSERPDKAKTRDLRDAIDAVLAGRAPAVTQTRVFGCSVKWKGKEDSVKQYMAKLAAEPVDVRPVNEAGLRDLRKNAGVKVRLVNLWATWCGPCVTEFPDLIEISRMYRHRNFELVTVSANFPDEKKDVLAFLTKQQSSGTNLLFASDDKYKLIEAFDKDSTGALPLTLLIAPGGEVLYRHEGAIDPLEVKRAIVKALKEDREGQ